MSFIDRLAIWYGGVCQDFNTSFIEDDNYKLIIEGIGNTVRISLLAVLIGILIGLVAALFKLSKSKLLRGISSVYTDIIRGTPAVTQLLIIYFVIFGSVYWEKWIIASIAFGINSGAYVSEIVRAGIQSIDVGQTEAGRSLGMTSYQTMRYIIIPQAVKNIFPALCNEFIVLIKETAIVGYIGMVDIAKAGEQIRGKTFLAFMPLIGTALIYFVLIKILTILFSRLEKNLRKSDLR